MGKVAKKIAENQQAENTKPTQDDLVEMSGDLLGAFSVAHDLPVDFDGVACSVLREPGTNRLLAVILSPVDMYGDEPCARYKVEPDSIVKPKTPKLIITS